MGHALYADGRPHGRLVQLLLRGLPERLGSARRGPAVAGKSRSRAAAAGRSEPYKLVWQVRANGTNRILPVYDPDAVRKAVKSMPLGTASGFVVEGLETYYPKSPRYYLADPKPTPTAIGPRARLDVSQPLGPPGLRSRRRPTESSTP